MMPDLCDAPRRVDWRFLLDEPSPATATVVGDRLGSIAVALAELGVEIVEPERSDVIVVCDPSDELLADLARHHGPVVVETRTRRGRLRVGRLLARVDRSTAAYGCWPSCAEATRFVPLDDRDELIDAARAVKNTRRRAVSGVLARIGLGSLVYGESVTIAVRCATPAVPSPARIAFGDEPSSTTLLTPRFGTSRHVIALVRHRDGRRLVVKTPRRAGDDEQLRREVDGLRVLDAPSPERPRLVDDVDRFDRRWVVQTLVEGAPLSRGDVANDVEHWVAAAHRWLAELPVADASRPDDDGRLERLLLPALEVATACADAEPDLRPLVAAAERAVDVVRRIPMPVVVEHGDFRPPNLLATESGALAVVDWELAVRAGMPLHDVLFFHDYVGRVVPSHRDALRRAADEVARALGLDPQLVPALNAIMFVRQVADIVQRDIGASDAGRSAAVNGVAAAWSASGARCSSHRPPSDQE